MSSDEPTVGDKFSALVIDFETCMREKPPSEWLDTATKLIDGLFDACTPLGLTDLGVDAHICQHWYTRVAAGLTRVVSSPDITLSADQLLGLSKRKQQIVYIFSASGYGNTKHLLTQLGKTSAGEFTVSLDRLALYFAFVSLDDVPPRLLEIALSQTPDVTLLLMLGWLNQRVILSEQGERNRSRLLESGENIRGAKISDQMIQLLVNAWMYSTYAEASHKHQLKADINHLLRGLLTEIQLDTLPEAVKDQTRPRLLVIHERFIKQHAMFRCYAPHLKRLKQKFDLIALAEVEHIDDASDTIFDTVLRIDDKIKNIPELVRKIRALKPDMIYYPSLGMSHWTVMLAQLRLAPIQIMTHGHPATSMSDVIDYAYVSELEGDVASLHSEKVILGSKFASFAPHSDLPSETPPLLLPSNREVRVAVNSKVMKLSHRLLTICRRLRDDASVPVRFSFFPGERGMFFDGLSPAIKAHVPDSEVARYVDYQTFLSEMCRCDLALAAFPFGNTNCTVDTCLLGLPTVVHFGPESPSQTDKIVLETAGYPDWLVCDTDEKYFETALALINDPDLRMSVTKHVDLKAVRTRLFDRDNSDFGVDPLADVFHKIYEQHATLMASNQRVFRYDELLGARS